MHRCLKMETASFWNIILL